MKQGQSKRRDKLVIPPYGMIFNLATWGPNVINTFGPFGQNYI